MRILAFADIHGSPSLIKSLEQLVRRKPDLCICCGDFTLFEQRIEYILASFERLGVPVLILHGNHEDEATVRHLCRNRKNLHFVHKRIYWAGDVAFVGYGGDGFSVRDKAFETFMYKQRAVLKKARSIVLVTHGPPYNTALDDIGGWHVGNKSYRDAILKDSRIRLALSGHIHETFGRHGRLGKATLLNPGPKGKVIVMSTTLQ
ncbi:metallophosphoesterase [Candidatus Woesearchaeota archaeon]|nr:metallophosphoesterase [Candidatus Woesearchaeota archaeon]